MGNAIQLGVHVFVHFLAHNVNRITDIKPATISADIVGLGFRDPDRITVSRERTAETLVGYRVTLTNRGSRLIRVSLEHCYSFYSVKSAIQPTITTAEVIRR